MSDVAGVLGGLMRPRYEMPVSPPVDSRKFRNCLHVDATSTAVAKTIGWLHRGDMPIFLLLLLVKRKMMGCHDLPRTTRNEIGRNGRI